MLRKYISKVRNKTKDARDEIYSSLESVFDRDFYLSNNADLAEAKPGFDALDHFINHGEKEGRDPTPGFSTKGYLDANPDIAEAGMNGFYHYTIFGKQEGRLLKPAPVLPEVSQSVSNVVAAEFDVDFYVKTCPVKVTREGALAHYLEFGVGLKCDPNSNFSTEFYLNANKDVRDSGVNPLFHYITCGRAEGRSCKPSGIVPVEITTPLTSFDETQIRTGVIAIVKNEMDIIHTFVESIMGLFDVVVMIDHRSEDGTAEFLKEVSKKFGNFHFYTLEEQGYHQALTMTHMLRSAPELVSLDWVFFLDADEFLPFSNRESFHSALAKNSDNPIISMRWSNLVPQTYWPDVVEINADTVFFHNPELSSFTKIALQPALLDIDKIWIEQGNHTVSNIINGLPIPAHSVDFPLYHIPVRSQEQLLMKLNQGVISYAKIGKNRDKLLGVHWFQIQESIRGTGINSETLNAVVDEYGYPNTSFAPLTDKDLLKKDYFLGNLDLAKKELGIPASTSINFAEIMFRFNAEAVADVSEEEQVVSKLVTYKNGKICRAKGESRLVYAPLPADSVKASGAKAKKTNAASPSSSSGGNPDIEFLQNFMKPSYWDIRHLTPSAWGGHIPFLFSLTAMEEPRRYVELGSHFGASFFAFCQTVERSGFECEPIAVDCWEGDIHTEKYDETVFNQFKFILENYKEFASFLRMFFNDAAKKFAPGSVDLLHIDGLHTYEAVRQDYETWLPKMSDRGVIMFHDINVHERDFGVWKLWEELRDVHPNMEFRHSHGLGIAYVGKKSDRPIEKLIKIFNNDRWAKVLIQQHFEEISQKSIELSIKRFDQGRYEEQGKQFGVLNEEISRLRQNLEISDTARAQLAKLLKE